jgi:polar amino acid transport system substrate-binding protein
MCGVLLVAGLAVGGAKAQEAAVKELIPTGKLRFGVAFAPKMSALFVVKDAGGSPRGVTADLGNELAQFGPAYCLVESTYMVTGASGIRTLAEVDRPGVRVVGIANTTTIRAALIGEFWKLDPLDFTLAKIIKEA